MSDSQKWLESLGLGQYASTFEKNAVELDVIPMLTEDHLKDLGISALGHRLRIMDAAKSIQLSATQATTKSLVEKGSSNGEAKTGCDACGTARTRCCVWTLARYSCSHTLRSQPPKGRV